MGAHFTTWTEDLEEAFKALELAETYADDGGWLTAAVKAELAASLFRKAYARRTDAIAAEAAASPHKPLTDADVGFPECP